MSKKVLVSAILSSGFALLIGACGGGGGSTSPTTGGGTSSPTVQSVSFKEVPLPQSDADLKSVKVSPALIVKYSDGSTKEYPLSYEVIAKTGDKIGSWEFGMFYDIDLQPILADDGSKTYSQWPDANSLIKVNNTVYLITHFEEPPGLLYKTQLDNNGKAVKTEPIDFKDVSGTIINCAGSLTPWNTHLGGEEDYDLNPRYADKNSPYYVDCDTKSDGKTFTGTAGGKPNSFCKYVAGAQKYLKDYNIDKNNGYNGDKFTPYNYGYIIEVAVNPDGTTKVAKHYITGKYTPELAIVMPDRKTIYISDDGEAKGLYKLVLDQPQNSFNPNWSGTLYMAKVTQVSDQNGGEFNIEWIKLGHASDNEIKELISRKLQMSDIFMIGDTKNCDASKGYKLIYEDGQLLCIKPRTGADRSPKFKSDDEVLKAAAFLETRKYGAYLGATTEFNKGEGLIYDPDRNVVYFAITEIGKGMLDNYKSQEPANHIRLPENKCGAVYEMVLDSNYNGIKLRALVVGKPLKPGDPYSDQYACDPNGISNPDNLAYLGNGILLIGEDTKYHLVNMVWAYDTNKKTLTRIAYVPIGAEVTGVFARTTLPNGQYIMTLNVQHPYQDIPRNASGQPVRSDLFNSATADDKKGIVGYIKGIPAGLFKY